ncbi:selenide, water dikinase SelD [bacterium]|nr:selenide, water dikinase SelD [bacterium]
MLEPVIDPRVLISAGTADDAGVYRLDDETALVFTLDLFTPVVDDARDFGRIGAANSISDVYAMGAKPLIALNIVCFPDGELPNSVLGETLAGAQEKALEAGVLTIGGHSVSDREFKFGMAVVGTVHPDRIVANAGAEPGDVLVLTKPLGTGVLSTAIKYERLSPEGIALITETMATLSRPASEAMVAAGVHAATDVTGFGLVGHALEMADAGGVTFEVRVDDLPFLDGAREHFAAGIAPGGLGTNRAYFAPRISVAAADGVSVDLAFDPQTSGGLLVSLPEEGLPVFERTMAAAGARWWRIGRVVPSTAHPLVLL